MNMNNKSGAFVPKPTRYSNLEAGTGGLTGGQSGSGTTGSGTFDYYSLINTGIGAVQNIVTSIWGRSDKYKYEAVQMINEEKSKINAILWVVIGLMAALGIFLLIRKTK